MMLDPWMTLVLPPVLGLAVGLVAGRCLRRPPPPNPWARRTARDWQTLERWTQRGDRDADA